MMADATISFLVLIALLMLFYGPWQALCTDITRHLIFEKRDELFDLARDRGIPFTSSEYQRVRRQLNACIRYAHDLSVPRLLYNEFAYRETDQEPTSADVQFGDPILRLKVKSLMQDVDAYLAFCALGKSLSFWVFMPVVIVIVVAAFLIDAIHVSTKHALQILGNTAQRQAGAC